MDEKKIGYFKDKLLKEKKKQVDLLKSRNNEIAEDVEFLDNELSSYGNHPADLGTEVYRMEQEEGFKEQIKRTISEINSSLKDIEDGVYGICGNCNKEIKEERLELIPYAKTCLECSDEKYEGFKADKSKENIYESLNFKSFKVQSDEGKNSIGHGRQDSYDEVLEDNLVPDDPSKSTGDNLGLKDLNSNKTDSVEDIENISEEDYKDTIK